MGKNCLWVEIIERAYAASGLAMGRSPFVLGVSEYSKAVPSQEELNAGHPVTADTPSGSDKIMVGRLPQGHAYTVTGVEQKVNKEGKILYFIKLRNPWGRM